MRARGTTALHATQAQGTRQTYMQTASIAKASIELCPNSCSNHGQCYNFAAQPHFPAICLCYEYYEGPDCGTRKINPFKIKTRDRPHWPELMDADKQKAETQRWAMRAGVSCGGVLHAARCDLCGDPSKDLQEMCGGECLFAEGKCILNTGFGDVVKRRPPTHLTGRGRMAQGRGRLAKGIGRLPGKERGAPVAHGLEEVTSMWGDTVQAWRSRQCKRLFMPLRPSAVPGLKFDRTRGIYGPPAGGVAGETPVRVRRLQTVEDTWPLERLVLPAQQERPLESALGALGAALEALDLALEFAQ
uniref:EGF-like domain-containing protein n=1 Tax=Haptolina brevifila TaxID=156173 RepID=A0A7S2II06_9EUKA